MPLGAKDLAGNTREITYVVDGGDAENPDDTALIVYRPGLVTPATLTEVRDAAKRDEGDQAVPHLLSRILVSWEVNDTEGAVTEAGSMWPVTFDALCQLPLAFLGDVLAAIQADMEPEGKARSGSPSPRKA